MTIFSSYQSRYDAGKEEELSIKDYLDICRTDRSAYATAAERMLMAMGEPELVDTRLDPRLSRMFSNKIIKIYPAFREFYGMEGVNREHRVIFPTCRSGPGGKKTDSVPARPGW